MSDADKPRPVALPLDRPCRVLVLGDDGIARWESATPAQAMAYQAGDRDWRAAKGEHDPKPRGWRRLWPWRR